MKAVIEPAVAPATPETNGHAADVLPLLPRHLKELRASGLSDDTIRAAKIRSEENRDKIAAILDWKSFPAKYGNSIVFPYLDDDGNIVQHSMKPDVAPQFKGKPRKYLRPKAPARLYVPPGARPALADPAKPLFVTEGEKKSLKATQEGFPCVGLSGVDMWHSPKSQKLRPDLERIAWKGRKAYVVFDSDAATNENVERNAQLLARAIENAGAAEVRIVRLPAGPNGEKIGVDDFLVERSAEAFKTLVDESEKAKLPKVAPETSKKKNDKPEAKGEDPQILADAYLSKFKNTPGHPGVLTLRRWRGQFWRWTGSRYQKRDDEDTTSNLVNWLNCHYCEVTSSAVRDALMHVRAKANISSQRDEPMWLGMPPGDAFHNAHELLICKNAIVHLPTLAVAAPTPDLFNLSSLPQGFVDGEYEPPNLWSGLLNATWPEDREAIDTLQEWFGYCLTSNCDLHTIFAILGPPRSGKGTIARVLEALLGPDNYAAGTIQSLATRFGLQPLVGKLLMAISDARLNSKTDTAVALERMLNISGQDPVLIDVKNKPALTWTLPTKIMIVTNELPPIVDASQALLSRVVLIKTSRTIPEEKRDPQLFEQLSAELPQILRWAIEGYQRLMRRGRFLQPESGNDDLEDWADETNPVTPFVREKCVLDAETAVDKKVLYQAYVDWQRENRPKGAYTVNYIENDRVFGRRLRGAVPGVKSHRPREGGVQVNYYKGIRLRTVI